MDNAKVAEILRELWRYKDTDKYTEEEIREALEKAASAFSGGEYIKKEDMKQLLRTIDFYSDLLFEIDDLDTYFIPDSADIEKIRAEIEEDIRNYRCDEFVDGMRNALEIIDKHIGGKDK